MPPFASAVDETPEALVRPALMKVALLNAAADVRARIVRIAKTTASTVIEFDRDVPQALIVEKLAGKLGGSA